jgi:undecaprenyl diphosphate synthase
MRKNRYFHSSELAALDFDNIPKHVAIIPDGNRRWARQQNFEISDGHHEGADTLMTIVKAAKDLGVQTITFYLFSTENWSRPKEEVDALMCLLEIFLVGQRETMLEEGVRLSSIGDPSKLPESSQAILDETRQITRHCNEIELVTALNYGARNELTRAFHAMLKECLENKFSPGQVSEEMVSSYLDTARWPDPELLIRTSGESRLSNFLLWQLSYSEIYVTEQLWPDFRPRNLLEALLHYQHRERRRGG